MLFFHGTPFSLEKMNETSRKTEVSIANDRKSSFQAKIRIWETYSPW